MTTAVARRKNAAGLGNISTTSARRLISLLSRSIVICSLPGGVFDVRHEALRSQFLRGGHGYLQPSRRQSQRRSNEIARVVSPVSPRESWTVVGDDDPPLAPVERYLGYLTGIERSPNTVKAYAHDLKDWFGFLAGRGLGWRTVGLEDVGAFVAWLRFPVQARAGGWRCWRRRRVRAANRL